MRTRTRISIDRFHRSPAARTWLARFAVAITSTDGYYWREDGHGYTSQLIDAWIVMGDEAYRITKGCGPEKRIVFEIIAKAPEREPGQHIPICTVQEIQRQGDEVSVVTIETIPRLTQPTDKGPTHYFRDVPADAHSIWRDGADMHGVFDPYTSRLYGESYWDTLSRAMERMRWRSVADVPVPLYNIPVIVWNLAKGETHGIAIAAVYDRTYGWISTPGKWPLKGVTHWMLGPEEPKP